jgi:serine/threonine-protein kinase
MAPEQAMGAGRPDARADLYGLGAVAYYLLTGRAPFTGPTAMALLVSVARDPVEPPSRYRPGVPLDLERVVLRCLAKSADDRYPDANALERDLAACAAVSEWDSARAAAWWRALDSRTTVASA